VLFIAVSLAAAAAPAGAQTPDGAAVFAKHCASCHAGAGVERAPSQAALRERTPEAILGALVNGVMASQAAALTDAERRSVAEYLSGRRLGADNPAPVAGRCAAAPPPLSDPTRGPHWNGWGITVTNSRFQPANQARLTAEQVPRLRLKWAFGFPEASSARSQPAVAGGRVFVGSEGGAVYSLDAKTGCVYWTFPAGAGVRTGMTLGPRAGASGTYALYFGDVQAHVYAVDAASGELLWKRKIDDHPHARITGTPVVFRDLVYVPVNSVGEEGAGSRPGYACCTSRGSVTALDAGTGTVRWKTYTVEEPTFRGKTPRGGDMWGPSGANIWSAPTIDAKRGVLYVGTGNQFSGPERQTSDAILAMDLESGAIKWVNQRTAGDISIGGCRDRYTRRPDCPERGVGPDVDFGSSSLLVTLPNGRDLLLAPQKNAVIWALDPDNKGSVVWEYRAGKGGPMGGFEWGAATDGELIYGAISDDQSSIFSNAADLKGDVPGGLHAVRIATGERAWFAPPRPPLCGSGRGCSAAQSAAVTAIPGVVFSGSIDGGIRAYSSRDGSVLWEFDTNREFETVNGVKAKGASIGGPGPVVVDGMLYVNSGYSTGGRPGNVLLAFEPAP
jgi:polyvinyl alcohol dehydrogenase (cytochrome)